MPKRPLQDPTPAIAAVVRYCERIDSMVPRFRTVFLLTGLVAAALKFGTLGDYLFGAGLLLHWAIWFQSWWAAADLRG